MGTVTITEKPGAGAARTAQVVVISGSGVPVQVVANPNSTLPVQTVSAPGHTVPVSVGQTPAVIQGPKGDKGEQGNKGDAGTLVVGSGDLTHDHFQATASASWVINHGLQKYPSVVVIDSALDECEGAISYDSINQITINFSAAFSGHAYLN